MVAPTSRYADFYAALPDPVADGDYAAAYAAYLTPGDPAPLFDIIASPASQGVYAYLGTDTRVHFLHQVRGHAQASFGAPPSVYYGAVVAVRDERTAVGSAYATLEVDLLADVAANDMRQGRDISQALAAEPQARQLAAAAATDPNLQDIATRACLLVPHVYVPALLRLASARNGIGPRSLFEWAEAAQQSDAAHPSHQPWFDWCHVAVSHGVAAANPLQLTRLTEPTVVAPDATLGDARAMMETACFPAIAAALNPIQVTATQVAGWRQDQADREDRAAADKAAEKAEKESPAHRWTPGLLQRAINLSRARDARGLPPVYISAARHGATNDGRTIDGHIEVEADEVFLRIPLFTAPAAPQAVKRCLTNLRFGHGREEKDGLLNIFMWVTRDDASRAAIHRVNYRLDEHEGTSLVYTPADAEKMDEAQAASIPSSWFELRKGFTGYHRAQQVFLGDDHALPHEFRLFILDLDEAGDLMNRKCRSAEFCAGVLRRIQLLTSGWVAKQQASLRRVDVPEYRKISDQIIIDGSYSPPDMPEWLQKAFRAPSAAPNNSPTGGNSTNSGAIVRPKTVENTAHRSSNYDPSINIGPMTKAKSPGDNDDGHRFCLTYHVKGRCMDNCYRILDHRAHNANEVKRLAAYLAEMKNTAN